MGVKEALGTPAALAGAAAAVNLFNTATRDHRVYTHRSLAFKHDSVRKAAVVMGGHLTDTKRWASVHRIHHSTPDANLETFVALADYVDFLHDGDADNSGHPELPDVVYGYDPAVESIDIDAAYEIGYLARELVMGKYRPQTEYRPIEGAKLFSKSKKYPYEDLDVMKRDRQDPLKFDPDNPPSLHDIRFLLRDPHSPALSPRGIPGVSMHNVSYYAYPERNFEDPFFRPEDLQPDELEVWVRENRNLLRAAYVGGMVVSNVLLSGRAGLIKTGFNAVMGAVAGGAGVGGLIAGGNITNAFGHAGDWKRLTPQEFWSGVVYPKPDGTYTSKNHWLSAPTLDEVGGQEVHHRRPDLIAYTEETGAKGIKEAAFGKGLELLVRASLVFEKGDQFDGQPRPDLPSEAVNVLEAYRRRNMPHGTDNPDSPYFIPR